MTSSRWWGRCVSMWRICFYRRGVLTGRWVQSKWFCYFPSKKLEKPFYLEGKGEIYTMLKNLSLNSVFFIRNDVHLWVFKNNSDFEGVRYSSNPLIIPSKRKVLEIVVGFPENNLKTWMKSFPLLDWVILKSWNDYFMWMQQMYCTQPSGAVYMTVSR